MTRRLHGLESWLPKPDEKPGAGATMFNLRRSSERGPRQPMAIEGRQRKAEEGVVYQTWNRYDADAVLVVARTKDGDGRMLSVPGIVWRQLCDLTNAPCGEVPLTDDDLETLLCDRWHQCYRIKQATSFSTTAEEYTELKESLFRTDPDVLAYVRQQMDVTSLGRFDNERLERGLDMAWDRSGAGPNSIGGYEPERTWMKRAAERTSEILDARERKAAK